MKRYEGDYTEAFSFDLPDRNIRFGKGSSITAELVGIYMEEAARGMTITLDGDLSTVSYGIYNEASQVSITIGKDSEIQSDYTIVGYGQDQSVKNGGKIIASEIGILLQGSDTRVVNSSLIEASTGVFFQSSVDGHMVNGRSGEIDAGNYGVIFGGASDANRNKLVNLGTITSEAYAFQGSSSIEQVINRGVIEGDIHLSSGDDLFNGRGGRVVGRIDGGGDDDRYFIDDAKLALFEDINNGTDSVISSVDYELLANFENLTLTGRKHLVGRGNEQDNILTGNAGNNELYGGEGYNRLWGGHGKDSLYGGSSSDTFVFGTGDDRDTIRNFQDNVDYLDFDSWKGLSDFDVLLSHAREKNGDLIISFRGDVLTIENFTKAQFDIGDFAG